MRVSGLSINPRNSSFESNYFRTMTNSGPAASEHIEMDTMLSDGGLERDDDYNELQHHLAFQHHRRNQMF